MRSVGHFGLTSPGSTPCLATASLMAARSTIAGIPLERGNIQSAKPSFKALAEHSSFRTMRSIDIINLLKVLVDRTLVELTWSPGEGLALERTAPRFYPAAAASPECSPRRLLWCGSHHSYGLLPPGGHGWTEAACLHGGTEKQCVVL